MKAKTATKRRADGWKRHLPALAVGLVTVLVSAPSARYDLDPHHDGFIFKTAMDVLSGQMLFRDTFTQYGALTSLLHAAILAVLGKTIYALKLVTVLFYGATASLLFVLWRRFLPLGLVILSWALWLLMAPYHYWTLLPWSSVYALTLQLVSVYGLVRYLESGRSGWLVFSGGGAAMAMWFRQPVGIVVAAAAGIFFALRAYRDRRFALWAKRFGIYMAGFAAVSLPILLWLAVNSALDDWYLQSIVLAMGFARDRTESGVWTVMTCLFPTKIKGDSPLFGWWVLPIASIAVGIRELVRTGRESSPEERGADPWILLALVLTAGAAWHQYYPVTCGRHTFWGASLMFGFVPYLATIAAPKTGEWGRNNQPLFAGLATAALFFFPVIGHLSLAGQKLQGYRVEAKEPSILQGLYLHPENAKAYAAIGQAVEMVKRVVPDIKAVTVHKDALFLTLVDNLHNPTPMFVDWKWNTAAIGWTQRDLMEYIKKERPIVFTYGDLPEDYVLLARVSKIPTLPVAVTVHKDIAEKIPEYRAHMQAAQAQ